MAIAKNEPLAAKRRIGPIGVYTTAGVEAPDNLTFVGAGEARLSQAGVYGGIAGTVVPLGEGGQYYYEATQVETNFDGAFIAIKLNKAGYRIATGVDSMGAESTVVEGLLHSNSMIDGGPGTGTAGPTYSGSVMTSWRVRQFASAAALAGASMGSADGADGEIRRWIGTATVFGGKMSSFQLNRVL